MSFPEDGAGVEDVLRMLHEMSEGDLDPLNGRMWGHTYYSGLEDVIEIVRRAYIMYMDKTMLDFTVYPSVLRMENEVIGFAREILGGDESVVGNFTYGGTESIMLAVKAAREKFRKESGSSSVPEIVLPDTAHPAFYKSAEYLGLKVVRVRTGEGWRIDGEAVNGAIGRNTCMVVCSAPNYPFGVVDDVKSVADICAEKDVWLHVDACLGGFILPFLKEVGQKIPPFDFSVDGVTSISADFHKFGYAPRGASAILYRDSSLREGQIFVMSSWPGYPLVNTAVLSTRSAGTLAATWAVMNHLGRKGYVELAGRVLNVRRKLEKALPEMGFEIIGKPEASVLAFTHPSVDVFVLAEKMGEMGWYIQAQPGSAVLGYPKCIHMTINPGHDRVVDEFLRDLGIAMKESKGPAVENVESILEDIQGGLGLKPGELPENLSAVNELIHRLPPEMVESVLKSMINEVIFRPPADRG
ncbi:pyridoxal phosphate-dependent decarboxylase family protein [Geoglobus sp.]